MFELFVRNLLEVKDAGVEPSTLFAVDEFAFEDCTLGHRHRCQFLGIGDLQFGSAR